MLQGLTTKSFLELQVSKRYIYEILLAGFRCQLYKVYPHVLQEKTSKSITLIIQFINESKQTLSSCSSVFKKSKNILKYKVYYFKYHHSQVSTLFTLHQLWIYYMKNNNEDLNCSNLEIICFTFWICFSCGVDEPTVFSSIQSVLKL